MHTRLEKHERRSREAGDDVGLARLRRWVAEETRFELKKPRSTLQGWCVRHTPGGKQTTLRSGGHGRKGGADLEAVEKVGLSFWKGNK